MQGRDLAHGQGTAGVTTDEVERAIDDAFRCIADAYLEMDCDHYRRACARLAELVPEQRTDAES